MKGNLQRWGGGGWFRWGSSQRREAYLQNHAGQHHHLLHKRKKLGRSTHASLLLYQNYMDTEISKRRNVGVSTKLPNKREEEIICLNPKVQLVGVMGGVCFAQGRLAVEEKARRASKKGYMWGWRIFLPKGGGCCPELWGICSIIVLGGKRACLGGGTGQNWPGRSPSARCIV